MSRSTLLVPILGALTLALCGCSLFAGPSCGPSNCSGCCRSGECLEAGTLSACGIGGELCKTCEATGQACLDGFCLESCGGQAAACTSTSCCLGLECRSGTCRPPFVCAASGGACASGFECCSGLACSAETCQPCGQPGQPCCVGGTSCGEGYWCADGVTCSAYFHDTGRECLKNSDCTENLCLPLANGKNACTIPCTGAEGCLGGWECKALAGSPGPVCQCTPGPEVCNGEDDDCNSWVDDGYLTDDCQAILPASVCKNGACVCPEGLEDCGGRCVDLAWTDEHCGACGKSCLESVGDAGYPAVRGGGCFASACRSWEMLVQQGLRGYGTLLAVEGVLYMTSDGSSYYPPLGSLTSCPVGGCDLSSTTRVSSLESPRQMGTWAGAIYFATNDGIERYVPATGAHTVVAPEAEAAGGLAISSSGVLAWGSMSRTATDSGLKKCTLPACADATSLFTGEWPNGHLAIDATHVYWVGLLTDGKTEAIKRCALSGCPSGPEVVTQGGGEIVVDGGTLFWADMAANQIWSCPVAACTAPVVVSDKTYSPWGIAVDATHVYWTDDDYVLRCPRAGCGGEPERLARHESASSGRMLTLDATSVYWNTSYSVWKTAK